MTRAKRDLELRGGITAAAALLGVPLELVDGDEWSVEDGTVRVGLGYVAAEDDTDTAVARTVLLLWESAREARVAPRRRARRLAIGRRRPELEPALAAIDRLLAAADVVAALPAFRLPVAQAVAGDLPPNPGELPRHLQWLCLLLVAASDAGAGRRLAEVLAPEVAAEFERLRQLGGGQADVLRRVLAPERDRGQLERFERAFGVLVPPYERLLERDLAERGLGGRGAESSGGDEAGQDAPAVGSSGGASAEDAKPGGEAEDATGDAGSEAARGGDRQEGAEGADLFAAEQAGFVSTVLATPLPADGEWADGMVPPEGVEATGEATGERASGGGGGSGAAGVTSLSDYRARAREHAAAIEALREVWGRVIAERVGMRTAVSRVPEPDGEMLARDSLVRIVSEVVAGVERPRAFVSRERRPRRASRVGSTDYVLLIDRSASMQGAAAEAAADAALVVLESLAAVERDIAAEERALGIDLELSLRTALIVFDSEPIVVKPLAGALGDEARRRMHAEVRTPGGSTNDAEALAAAARELGLFATAGPGGDAVRPSAAAAAGVERRRVVLFVSDGGTDDGGAALAWIRRLRAAGVAVFGIGIRTEDVVRRFAPDGIRLDDASELAAELGRLVASAGLDQDPPRAGR